MLQRFFATAVCIPFSLSAQLVLDPVPYTPIANPLPDTMNQLYRDSVNLIFSPVRINQAGYRPQDDKYFYYIGSGSSSFSVIDTSGNEVGSGTLTSTGQTASGQIHIRASNNAQLVTGGDTRYIMESRIYSGPISEGTIPDLPPGEYRVVVGGETSAPFVIDEHVYSWVRDALLKFYGVNRCGDSHSWFHEACHLLDPVTGGWHDCGDHLKEGATMSYTASILGLAAAAFSDRDVDVYSANQSITLITDGIPDILYEAKHGADFILQSYDLAGGQVANMVTSVGDFGDDHQWWGLPENQDYVPQPRGGPPRPGRNEVGANYIGNYAANLAFVSKRIRPYDSAYADRCLTAAKDLYEFSQTNQVESNTPAYNGSGTVNDDIAFACLALLWATEERKYLEELCFDPTIGANANPAFSALFEGGWFTSTNALFSHSNANTDWGSTHAHVLWGFFRLILNDEALCTSLGLEETQRLALIEKTIYHLISNLQSVGLGNQTIELPNAGIWTGSTVRYQLPWFTMQTQMEWVWNRYQAGNITEMFYYYDMASKIQGMELPNTPASTDWKADEIKTILIRMLDYQLGVNPWDISMIYGVGDKNFNHPHHRAANPEGKNVPGAFYKYHPPVGALQGGYMPTNSLYSEHYDDYHHSETGIDGTTNIFMPVVGLAKEDSIGPPSATVRTVFVGCDEAIIEIRQTRYGGAILRYGTGTAPDMIQASDSAGVFHRIVLSGLTRGTTYNFDVLVSDVFGRDSVIRYRDEDKNLVLFSFTTLQNCPTDADIQNVKVCRVTHDSAEIFWYTPNGEFDSRVVYGEQPPPTTVHDGDIAEHPVIFHYVKIGGLTEQTTYSFYVESGDSRDDNNGQLYQFTTPVMHVDFDVRTVRYTWQDMTALGINVVNQDNKAYDSLDLRLYFRAQEGFEDDLAARLDIGIVYREDGFQDEMDENAAIRAHIRNSRPVKIEDTYDPVDQTWAYYYSVPLYGVEMKSGSRIRLDIIFDRRSPFPPYEDLMNQPPEHQISDLDWSFGPHSIANGDPVDFPGVPIISKVAVDSMYWELPINYYTTIYRKGEFVWGYSPSSQEMKTKKTYYSMVTQITDPLINPSDDYVFYERTIRLVPVSGWAKITPTDGSLNEIWINGVKQENPRSLFFWNDTDQRYDFTVDVPVQNGRNNVDITLFAGPPDLCVDCYGCAVSNHNFYIEFQGAKQYPSTLVLRDQFEQPLSDTVKLDTTVFHVIVTDRNGNINGQATDVITAWIKNYDNGDSLALTLVETGDSTGIFTTVTPVSVVDRLPEQSGAEEIAMNGGDRVRIWYIDPTDETDSSEAFITSKATFPVARYGWLKDSDGNGTVDRIQVFYSIPLKETPDSVSVDFPTTGITSMTRSSVDAMSFSETILSIQLALPFTDGITGFTSGLQSSGKSYLTSAGNVKTSGFELYDSIGPVLNDKAIVRERIEAGADTVTITISEAVAFNNFSGEALLLRRGGADQPLTVLGIISNDTNTITVLLDAGGIQFTAGDSLRLNSTHPLNDLSGNVPHPANRAVPVVIKASMSQVVYARYEDYNFDGIIDSVKMGFSKPIDLSHIQLGLRWGTLDLTTIDNSTVTFAAGSNSDIAFPIPEQITENRVNTGGLLNSTCIHVNFTGDTLFTSVADSAAPVIDSAWFHLYNGDTTTSSSTDTLDTLTILFSEVVDPAAVEYIAAFNLFSIGSQSGYTFNVSGKRQLGSDQYQFYGTLTGAEYPANGDLIWLQPESQLSDFSGNRQLSPENRKVPVTVDLLVSYFRQVYPNPFDPMRESLTIRMVPKKMRFEAPIDASALAVIYDKVGNVIVKLDSEPTVNGPCLTWNGTNTRGRYVGDGTYLCHLYFMDDLESFPIGVARINLNR